jgi:hypothetical protein
MSFGSLSPENRIVDYANALGLTHANVCALAQINPNRLSMAVRGLKALPNEESRRAVEILLRLLKISDAVAPLALPKNLEGMKLILKHFEGVSSDEIRSRMNAIFEQLVQ